MANLLAIETTTDICSVALHLLAQGSVAQNEPRDQVIENTRLAPRLHNRHVLAMVDEVLRTASINKKKLDVIAYGAGPGSFTGVRIGASVAQGIAFALALPVVSVPSSAVVAETVRRTTNLRGTFVVHRTSRVGWRYAARYALCENGVTCLAFDKLERDDRKPDYDGENCPVINGDRFAIGAAAVARVALRQPSRAVEPELALPFYVEGDSPWRKSA